MSRAYYSLFHEVQGLLYSAGIDIRERERSHKKLWQILNEAENDDIKLVADIYQAMLDERHSADYHIRDDAIRSVEEASTIVLRASKAIDIVYALRQDEGAKKELVAICKRRVQSKDITATFREPGAQARPTPSPRSGQPRPPRSKSA